MAAFVLTDVQLLLGSMELGPFSGEFGFEAMAAMKEANNFGARGYTTVLPGLTTASGSIKGHADYATGGVSAYYNGLQNGSQQAFTVVPNGSASVVGDACEFMRGRLSKIKMVTGAVGEVADFEITIDGDAAPIDGTVGAPLATRTTAGFTSASFQLGAIPAGKRLWVAQHVTAATGTNLVTTVQSDNAIGFPSSAVALTLPTVSTTGWIYSSVAGPMTDDWFRVVSTIATGTFTYMVAVGIQ